MIPLAFSRLVRATFRLHFRNRMALLYAHLFPAIVLLAVYGLYVHERYPLQRHLGQLLTITILSGACFALPVGIVRERERGVWRRYHLAPASLPTVVGATLLSHFLLLCLAGAIQLAIALALRTPLPSRPLDLAVAFVLTGFAFVGLGLLLSGLANSVNAAQALGQCVFLPMLMLGGVAVSLEALPEWARTLAAYLPGRYAVEAIQASATGDGALGMGFHLLALPAFGVTALLAGAWLLSRGGGAGERIPRASKARAVAALASWVAIGAVATTRGPYAPVERQAMAAGAAPGMVPIAAGGVEAPPMDGGQRPASADTGATPVAAAGPPGDTGRAAAAPPPVALQAVDRDVDYSRLPPDDGLVAPMARADEVPPPEVSDQIECMRMMLPGWGPARVADPVQRVRNHLYVAAVPDVYQTGDLEKWVPHLVAERLQREFPREELVRILHFIATHPEEGDLSAAGQLSGVCFERGAPSDTAQLRERVTFYALKLLGRATGRLPGS